MKRKIIYNQDGREKFYGFHLLLFLCLHLSFASCNPDSMDSNNEEEMEQEVDFQILFIGNSLTYTHNLPELVEELCKEENVIVSTEMVAYPNYAIVDHWADGIVQQKIRSKNFDFVVIQQGPSSQQDGYDMLVNGGKEYAALCEANDVKLAYFMVWPSRTWYHTFEGVIANYTAGAEANDAILCPVGKVWKEYIEITGDYSYYGPDGFHPSLEGSRKAAEVIAASLDLY